MTSEDILLHATYENKAKAIQMVGLRVGPTTKKGTGYTETNGHEYNPLRAETYKQSEEIQEETRPEHIPTRKNSIFFFPKEGSSYGDEPEAFITERDEWGRPEYDFGFGKNTKPANKRKGS